MTVIEREREDDIRARWLRVCMRRVSICQETRQGGLVLGLQLVVVGGVHTRTSIIRVAT